MLKLIRTDSDNNNFKALVKLLDADLAIRDGADHAFYAQYNHIDKIRNAVIAFIDDKVVACGAFKKYSDSKVEIKRMYVVENLRGQGIAQKVLAELEKWAAEFNFSECILETGKKQPEAINLYQKAGYTIIKNYGQYENIQNSVCMTKKI
jgi:GNAT superfamily N-acetyltransferase